jgi:hypothetical protein
MEFIGSLMEIQAIRLQIRGDYIIAAIPARTPAPFHPPGAI